MYRFFDEAELEEIRLYFSRVSADLEGLFPNVDEDDLHGNGLPELINSDCNRELISKLFADKYPEISLPAIQPFYNRILNSPPQIVLPRISGGSDIEENGCVAEFTIENGRLRVVPWEYGLKNYGRNFDTLLAKINKEIIE